MSSLPVYHWPSSLLCSKTCRWNSVRAALGKRVLVRIPANVPSILEGTLVGIRKAPDEAKLYKIVMTSDYCSIHEAEVWHITRLWHRVYMLGVTTEQLAEMVGSLLTKQVRARLGRKPRLGDVIGAVRLRSSGIWGDGCADGFLRRCLDLFFSSRDDEWHFNVSEKQLSRRKQKWPLGMLGPSPALHHLRLAWGRRYPFSWLREQLRTAFNNSARRQLFATDFPGHSPRATFPMWPSRNARNAAGELAVRQAEPDMVDERIWQQLPVTYGPPTHADSGSLRKKCAIHFRTTR